VLPSAASLPLSDGLLSFHSSSSCNVWLSILGFLTKGSFKRALLGVNAVQVSSSSAAVSDWCLRKRWVPTDSVQNRQCQHQFRENADTTVYCNFFKKTQNNSSLTCSALTTTLNHYLYICGPEHPKGPAPGDYSNHLASQDTGIGQAYLLHLPCRILRNTDRRAPNSEALSDKRCSHSATAV
jgi:hypothetical protein